MVDRFTKRNQPKRIHSKPSNRGNCSIRSCRSVRCTRQRHQHHSVYDLLQLLRCIGIIKNRSMARSTSHIINRRRKLNMFEVTAICKTATCSYLDKPSVFISDVSATQCGECGELMEVTTKEVAADAGTIEAE